MSFNTAAQNLTDECLGMWRFRWPALALAWIIALGGWLWALQIPDEYEAEARVYVDTDSMLGPLMKGLAVEQNTYDQITLISRALLSRPQLQSVAMETGLQIRAQSPEDFEVLLAKLERDIDFTETSRQRMYTISYRDHDPIMAHAVVKSLLDRFMVDSLNENMIESQSAQKFILKQLAENEKRLLAAENRLAEFKKRNVNMMPGQDGDFFQRLKLAQSNVISLQAQSKQAELRQQELLRQIEGEEPSFGIMDSSEMSDDNDLNSGIGRQIAELEARVKDMLLNLTEKHPDVIRTRERIATLRQTSAQASNNESQLSAPMISAEDGLDLNPVYQHMRIELSTSQVNLISLRAQLADEQKKAAFLRKMVDTIPEVEAELKQLNRDYGVVKTQYETLLGRLESAKLAEDIQKDTQDITFRVIDPPYVPITPSGPNRAPLITVVLLAALGASAALAYLLNQQNPVFFSARRLRMETGLPIFGVIGITKASQKIASIIWFTAGAGGLFALCFLLLSVERTATNALRIIISSL